MSDTIAMPMPMRFDSRRLQVAAALTFAIAVAVVAIAQFTGALADHAVREGTPQFNVLRHHRSHHTIAPTSRTPALPLPPAGANVVAVGDSWLEGTGATGPADGHIELTAAHFGWNLTRVPNGGGTGYINPGPTNAGTYSQRLAAMPVDPSVRLVILAGGINDAAYTAAPIIAAETPTIATARDRYPNARILVVGFPDPHAAPSVATTVVDGALAEGARQAGAVAINPDAEGWLVGDTAADFHADGPTANHPTAAGYAAMAVLLEADLTRLGG